MGRVQVLTAPSPASSLPSFWACVQGSAGITPQPQSPGTPAMGRGALVGTCSLWAIERSCSLLIQLPDKRQPGLSQG